MWGGGSRIGGRGTGYGKILLVGGYTVLEKPNKALVLAVGNACIHAIALDSSQWIIESSLARWSSERIEDAPGILEYVKQAVIATGRARPARIIITESRLMAQESKAGLGSSAAVTVAVVRALMPGASNETIYRVAYKAHSRAQGGIGSGFDVAASAYGATIVYERPSSLDSDDHVIMPVDLPRGLYIRAYNIRGSYTRTGVSARRVMEAVRRDAKTREVFDELATVNNKLVELLVSGRLEDAMHLFDEANRLRRLLGELSGVPIEPVELDPVRRRFEDEGFKTVLPGAGGYDMLVVIGLNPVPDYRIPGLEPLDTVIL